MRGQPDAALTRHAGSHSQAHADQVLKTSLNRFRRCTLATSRFQNRRHAGHFAKAIASSGTFHLVSDSPQLFPVRGIRGVEHALHAIRNLVHEHFDQFAEIFIVTEFGIDQRVLIRHSHFICPMRPVSIRWI